MVVEVRVIVVEFKISSHLFMTVASWLLSSVKPGSPMLKPESPPMLKPESPRMSRNSWASVVSFRFSLHNLVTSSVFSSNASSKILLISSEEISPSEINAKEA